MELTKTKLHKILKNYKVKLEQLDKEWEAICRKAGKNDITTETHITRHFPSDRESLTHALKGHKLFKDLMNEFECYEVFPKKLIKNINNTATACR
jgi:hypothetical protein